MRPDARLTLLISHGNGQDLQYLVEDVVLRLRCLGTPVNLVCYEYPGYSLSGLPTSEGLILSAADAAYNHVRYVLGIPPEQIVVYGISLGSGPAVYTAASYDVGGLILQSPYTSIGATKVGLDCAKILCLVDLFQSYRRAAGVSAPVLLYHGDSDPVVPPVCSRQLASLFPNVFGKPMFCHGAGHNDVIELLHYRNEYLPMIESFLKHVLHAKSSSAPTPVVMGSV
jgi:pimeloyl-ACP methyl ester carboxylesterase